MAAKIILKKSSVASKTPLVGDLDYGELAINYQDGKLWYKNASNNIKAFIDSAGMQTAIDAIVYTDSDTTVLVDSAYVQLRQDYAYSSLTGTPTIPALYTDFVDSAEARNLISVTDNGGDGSLTYNSTTGVITYTGPSASEVRAHFTGGSNINISNGVISLDSALSTSDVSEGTNKYYTTVRVDSDIDARVTKSFIDALNVDADTLDGQEGTYYRIDVYNSSGTLLN